MSCNCPNLPLPAIFIDNAHTVEMDTWYANNQRSFLATIMDPNGPFINYSANDIISMINYFASAAQLGATAIRIYLACYGDVGSPGLPDEGLANQFTFIFAPATYYQNADPAQDSAIDIGKYYNIPPGDSFNPKDSNITPQIFQAWTQNWQVLHLPRLPIDHTPINSNDPNGMPNPRYSETKCIFYKMTDMQDLVTEIYCQNAYGIRISLTSYPNSGKHPKRLTTQFKLTDSFDRPLNYDISCRQKKDNFHSSFDTGMPCPPYPGCNH